MHGGHDNPAGRSMFGDQGLDADPALSVEGRDRLIKQPDRPVVEKQTG